MGNVSTGSRARANGGSVSEDVPLRDGLACAALGLALRLAVAAWASSRFPPAEDGRYYHLVASRIAEGLGYTWQWPDGTVTYAAHYPVGFPAALGGVYALFGPSPGRAMVVSALLGSLSVLAIHRISALSSNRRVALVAGLVVAVHPALVFYTGALMTEGWVAALVAVAAWSAAEGAASGRIRSSALVLGSILGVATLVRPQCIALAPVFALVTWWPRGGRSAFAAAVTATLVAGLVCVPWTLRNCARMDGCAFVSANAGWNLLIGTALEGHGTWIPLDALGVPRECRTVFGEVEKDQCFGRAAVRIIRDDLPGWLALVPQKLAATFDYGGAPGWYLHASSPRHFDNHHKLMLGALETVVERVVVLGSLVTLARAAGPRRRARVALAVPFAAFLLVRAGWVTTMGLLLEGALLGRVLLTRPAISLALGAIAVTALAHATFFGAGRYAMVTYPLLAATAALAFDRRSTPG